MSDDTYMDGEFIGIYREPGRLQQRIPVRLWRGEHYDLLGNVIDLAKLEPVTREGA